MQRPMKKSRQGRARVPVISCVHGRQGNSRFTTSRVLRTELALAYGPK